MYGKVVNVTRPSAGIHKIVLKLAMNIVPDVMPMQEYPPAVNICPMGESRCEENNCYYS